MSILVSLWPLGRGGSGSIPFRRRLHAWWNGYELQPAEEVRRLDGVGDVEPNGTAAPGVRGGHVDPLQLTASWTEMRREVAEAVWTPGFISPGGSKYVEELVSGCTLTAAETLLEINIGTGGGTRTIIARFGNYVTAYESEEELAREARSQAVVYDLESKLDLRVAPYENMDIKSGYFRAALMRETLFMVEDKDALLAKVCRALKDGDSHLIITDFLFDKDDDAPALAAWIGGESRPVYPWTLSELRAGLNKYRVKVRIEEDQSERYCQMVTDAWAQYLAGMAGTQVSDEVGQQAMAEAAYWTRRVAALKSGALKYFMLKAVKSD